MKLILKYLQLFTTGGSIYILIELLYRGYTHWTMYILGGICFIAVGLLNEISKWNTPLIIQSVIGGIIITSLEFLFGFVVNIILNLDIWDYSNMPFNLLGQICLPFFFFWCIISTVAIVFDDYLRYAQGEEKPHYKII